jgi:hypothetical protein
MNSFIYGKTYKTPTNTAVRKGESHGGHVKE